MYSIVSGNEKFIRNMPVVGMTPSLYTIPNLNTFVSPHIKYQFYNPWSGQLGQTVSTHMNQFSPINSIYGTNSISDMFTNPQGNLSVKSQVYDRNGICVGLIGSNDDILKVTNCLDKCLTAPVSAPILALGSETKIL